MKSRWLRISAWLGIVFGVVLVLGETRRNWGAWGHWASYTFDYLFAVQLIVFGVLSLKGRAWGRLLLIASWALTVALFTYSFTGHVRTLDQPPYRPVRHLRLTIIIGAPDLFAIAGLALGLASFGSRKAGNRGDVALS